MNPTKQASETVLQSVEIHGLSSSGAGVGRLPSGRAVFVHRTAPGDTVSLDVVQKKARWARGRLVDVDQRSPSRRSPPCPYYDRCGGCTLQHLSYPAQLAGKRTIVEDALRRVGGLPVAVSSVIPSPRAFRYRTRATFHLRRHGARLVFAGFHTLEQAGRILDLDGGCLVLHERLAEAWDQLRMAWGVGANRLPAGPAIDLTLQLVDEGAVLTVAGGSGNGQPKILLRDAPALVSIWRTSSGGGRRRVAGRSRTSVTRGGQTVAARGDGFIQANREAAEGLLRTVVEVAGSVTDAHVVDAYSGAGHFGRALAARGARVTAIERDPPADPSAGESSLSRITGTVERHLSAALPADLVILNPPRAGISPDVVAVLASERPARIIYVSCDPATLARDLARLAPAYQTGRLSVHDLFPQTSHVETVVELTAQKVPSHAGVPKDRPRHDGVEESAEAQP